MSEKDDKIKYRFQKITGRNIYRRKYKFQQWNKNIHNQDLRNGQNEMIIIQKGQEEIIMSKK